eukprot:TRINITY_DN4083_c0_g1_i1.p1 TRINITY_DN4083_c0_g1~~TRINITY_DN4083_c0_g1_i1.p1  ORF type:complete len:514 (-),score=98.63 TRINITY_DN4083_c0_g1_i1:56-1597(-)
MTDLLAKYQDVQQEAPYNEEEEKNNVRTNNRIKWEAKGDVYMKKNMTLKMVEFDKPTADKLHLFISDGEAYASIFMLLLSKLSNIDDTKYLLTLLDDLFEAAALQTTKTINLRAVLSPFYGLEKTKPDPSVPAPPFGPILKVINLNRKPIDLYVLSLGSRILSTLILHYPSGDAPKEIVEDAFHWFIELLDKDIDSDNSEAKLKQRRISLGLVGLRPLLSRNEYRGYFVGDTINGLPTLMRLSHFEERIEEVPTGVVQRKKKGGGGEEREIVPKKVPDFGQIYEAVFCIWCLSFNPDVTHKLSDPKLIFNLCHIAKRCNKVKVIRISLAVLRNLLGVGKNNEKMITYGLLSSLMMLRQKRWGDEELENDIKAIEEALERNVDDLTSWDMYKNEIEGGQLEWSPSHKSLKFWQENYLKFEEDDFYLLRSLKGILEQSDDPKVKAIACWDVGEFVRVHPGGKRICQMLDLKTPIMKHLAAQELDPSNEDLQKLSKEALTALQKLMITNWEYLQAN